MSMVMMPLLIKAPMKKENYIALLEEASKSYSKIYLRKNYLFDGSYFTLDTCDMDTFEIFDEAALIAKYAEPTDYCVGLIYAKGISHSFDDLYFENGKYRTVSNAKGKRRYLHRKAQFLNEFPGSSNETRLTEAEIEAVLGAVIVFNTFNCIGIEPDALDAIFRKSGHAMDSIHMDMGCVDISLEDKNEDPDAILANYFECDRVSLFCSDGDQSFPNSVMILLQNAETND